MRIEFLVTATIQQSIKVQYKMQFEETNYFKISIVRFMPAGIAAVQRNKGDILLNE